MDPIQDLLDTGGDLNTSGDLEGVSPDTDTATPIITSVPAGIMSLVLNGNDFYWQLIFYDLTSGAISVTLNDKHRAIFDLGSKSNPSNIPFRSPVIGGGKLTDEQVCKLLKSRLSLVIATTLNPKGELATRIRRKDVKILRDC